MTGEGKKIARYILLKRLGLIGLAVSSGLAVVFLVLSLLPQGNTAFTIRIDNPLSDENSNFRMHLTGIGSENSEEGEEQEQSNGFTYLKGDPLKTVEQTTASNVEDYLQYLRDNKKLSGSTNMNENHLYDMHLIKKPVDDPSDLALIYTVYLSNETNNVSTKVNYAVDLEGYENAQLLESARVLIQIEENGDGNYHNYYFGKERNPSNPFTQAYDNGDVNNREIVSDYVVNEETSSITPVIKDAAHGDTGYCEKFNFASEKRIIDSSVEIKDKLRFTFVCYFETKDPDRFPDTGYILMSLHFGI